MDPEFDSTRYHQCIEILERTHDGDDLHPSDLRLVEHVLNGRVPHTEPLFMEVLNAVRTGTYPPRNYQ